MDRPLMAPSIAPISIALAVPTACDEHPMAIPLAIGSSIRSNLSIPSANIFPRTPVIIITTTDIDT